MRRSNGNHAEHTAQKPEGDSLLQAGLATGYLCRRAEEQLQQIAAAAGGAISARELGGWLGRFFHQKSKANGAGVDDYERLPEMRSYPAAGYALGAGEAQAYVRPRGKRALSKKARKAIARAQKLRWAKFHAQGGKGVPGRKGNAKRDYKGKHWTQLPGGREKMRQAQLNRYRKAATDQLIVENPAKGKRKKSETLLMKAMKATCRVSAAEAKVAAVAPVAGG